MYVCGPQGFIEDTLTIAARSGWPAETMHREFFAPTAVDSDRSDRSFEIQIASSGARYIVPTGASVADVLARNGVEVPMSCEQGICGTCLTRVLSGIPDHRDTVLTDEEHARNDVFAPCCSRAKSDLLVLDL